MCGDVSALSHAELASLATYAGLSLLNVSAAPAEDRELRPVCSGSGPSMELLGRTDCDVTLQKDASLVLSARR